MFIDQRDPCAGANSMQAAFPHKVIVVDAMDQTTGDIACALNIAVRQQQPKLITPQTRQHIAGAQHG